MSERFAYDDHGNAEAWHASLRELHDVLDLVTSSRNVVGSDGHDRWDFGPNAEPVADLLAERQRRSGEAPAPRRVVAWVDDVTGALTFPMKPSEVVANAEEHLQRLEHALQGVVQFLSEAEESAVSLQRGDADTDAADVVGSLIGDYELREHAVRAVASAQLVRVYVEGLGEWRRQQREDAS